nr:hypothetical protein [uncultured Caldimonas sp.]
MHISRRFPAARFAVVTVLALQLTACGGGGGSSSDEDSSETVYQQDWAFPAQATLAPERAQAVVDRLNEVRTSVGLDPLVRSQSYDSLATANVQAYTAGDGSQRSLPMLHQLNADDGTDDRGMTHLQSYSVYAAAWSGNGYGHGWHAVDRMLHEPSLRLALLRSDVLAVGAEVGGHRTAGAYWRSYGFALLEMLVHAPNPQGRGYVYPFNGQQNVPPAGIVFDSGGYQGYEFASNGGFGYPISVHADRSEALLATSFTLTTVTGPSAGQVVPGTWADSAHPRTGVAMPGHAAVLYPSRLSPEVTYEVRFEGTLDGNPLSITSQFTTAGTQVAAQSIDRTSLRDGDVATLTGSWNPETEAWQGPTVSRHPIPGYADTSEPPLPLDIDWVNPTTARLTPSGACIRNCPVGLSFPAGYIDFEVN